MKPQVLMRMTSAASSSGVTTAPCPTSSPTSRSESTVALSQPREMTPSFIRGSSLGCDKATVDSERLVGELVGHGAVVTPELPSADVILVNTCGFIDAAKQESIDAMLEAAKLKDGG